MKKTLAIIVMIVITLLCVYALAEGAKEITFQGVPWFSSPKEVTKLLGKSGFTNGKSFNVKKLTDSKSLSRSNIAYYNEDEEVPYKYSRSSEDVSLTTKLLSQWQNNVKKTIAQHEVHFLNAYYTAETKKPQLVEFEMTLRDPEGGHFDEDAIYSALESAFGEPKVRRNGKEYIWLGENNTIAILNRSHVVFATLSGLEYAESIELNLKTVEDTGF